MERLTKVWWKRKYNDGRIEYVAQVTDMAPQMSSDVFSQEIVGVEEVDSAYKQIYNSILPDSVDLFFIEPPAVPSNSITEYVLAAIALWIRTPAEIIIKALLRGVIVEINNKFYRLYTNSGLYRFDLLEDAIKSNSPALVQTEFSELIDFFNQKATPKEIIQCINSTALCSKNILKENLPSASTPTVPCNSCKRLVKTINGKPIEDESNVMDGWYCKEWHLATCGECEFYEFYEENNKDDYCSS